MNGKLDRVEPFFLKHKHYSLAVTVVTLAYLMISIPDLKNSRFMVGFLAFASAALIFIASFNKGYIYCPKTIRKLLLWIGSRSYGIYVIHMPAIYFIQETTIRYYISIGQGPSKSIPLCAVMTLSTLALTVLLVEMNYHLVEKPLRNYGRRLANKSVSHLRGEAQA